MKRGLLFLLLFFLCSLVGALEVQVDASLAPEALKPVEKAVRHATWGIEGEDLYVTLSSFIQDERVTSVEVELSCGGEKILERPSVATGGWQGRMRKLLEKQLSYDLGKLYPPKDDAPVLEELYMVRPSEGDSFRPGQVYKARGGKRSTGLLVVRDVYPEVVRLDAISDHGIHIGQTLSRSLGLSVEGWFSMAPRGGEISMRLSWPYPFELSFALSFLDDRVLFEAGLEKIWPLSSVSHSWFLRNSSLGAGVRMGIASPFALGASASITWRIMVMKGLSLALGGRLLYYGNQEEKKVWQDGYQFLCGVGYNW